MTHTFVVIDEIEMENWGVGGVPVPVPEYRKQLAEKAAKQK